MGINWTKSAVVLALLCAAFSFIAIAQTDTGKPLDAKTLAALVAELKGVVARTATQAGEAAMVARKWDARRDLAGKTKLAVINLLFEDVRSSVNDSGTQYQISSMFGMYKIMPDDAFKSEASAAKEPVKLIFETQAGPDKPLDAKTLAALVSELKGVVTRSAPEAVEAATVARKWDARRDLAGKTKRSVINLLFEDVKSSVKDAGTQYTISSIFGMYKIMPDDAFAAETPKTKGNVSKTATVDKLVDLTYRTHPYVGIEDTLNALPGTKEDHAAKDEAIQNRIAGFEEALKVNNQLTAAQKSFVRTNYDFLAKLVDSAVATAISKNFPTEQWIEEGLQQSYASKFTPAELNSLITYFQGKAGKRVLDYTRVLEMRELIVKNGGTTTGFTKAEKAEHGRFTATPLGKKFMTAYLQEAIAYEEGKENAVRSANPDADGFAIYRPENMNKLINKFVADNYKK